MSPIWVYSTRYAYRRWIWMWHSLWGYIEVSIPVVGAKAWIWYPLSGQIARVVVQVPRILELILLSEEEPKEERGNAPFCVFKVTIGTEGQSMDFGVRENHNWILVPTLTYQLCDFRQIIYSQESLGGLIYRRGIMILPHIASGRLKGLMNIKLLSSQFFFLIPSPLFSWACRT